MPSKYRPPSDPGPAPQSMWQRVGSMFGGQPAEASQAPPEDVGMIRKYGPHVIRGAGGFLGFTPMSGALAGGGSEILAEMLEKGTFNPLNVDPARVAAETAVGAMGGKFAKSLVEATKLGKVGAAALRGGALGASSPIVRHGIEHGDANPLNYPGEILAGGGLGAATAGGMAKLFGPKAGSLSIDPRNVPPPAPPPPPPSVAELAAGIRAKGKQGLRVAVDKMEDVPLTRDNPYKGNLDIPPTLDPNSPEYQQYLRGELSPLPAEPKIPMARREPVKNSRETIAQHEVIADNMQRDPAGEIGRRVRESHSKGNAPSIVEMEQLHGDAVALGDKTEKARQAAIQTEMVQATRNEKAADAYVNKTAVQESRNLNAADKAVKAEMAARLKAQSEVQKVTDKAAGQEAKNLNTRDKYLAEKLEQDTAAARIRDMAEEGLEPVNSISERYQQDLLGGKRTGVTRWVKKAEEGPDGPSGGGTRPLEPNPDASGAVPVDRNFIETNSFGSKQKAIEAAMGHRVLEYRQIGKRGGWRVILAPEDAAPARGLAVAPTRTPGSPASGFDSKVDDILKAVGSKEPPIEPPPAPTPNPVPNGGPKKPSGGATPTDAQRSLHGKRVSKKDAQNIVKEHGGEIVQYGERKFAVKFPEVEAERAALSAAHAETVANKAPAPTPTAAKSAPAPKPWKKAEPGTKVDPNSMDHGFLDSQEEWQRWAQGRPGSGVRATPEWRALEAKRVGGAPVVPEVSETPVLHQIEAPVPAAKAPEATKDGFTPTEAKRREVLSEKPNLTPTEQAEWDALDSKLLNAPKPVEFVNVKGNTLTVSTEEEMLAAIGAGYRPKNVAPKEPPLKLGKGMKEVPLKEADRVVEPEMAVDEFAQALAKEGEKPIAEVPFSLGSEVAKTPKVETPDMFAPEAPARVKSVGAKPAKFTESENPQMDELMNALHGEEGSLPKINPKGHGTMPAEETPADMTARFKSMMDEKLAKAKADLQGKSDALKLGANGLPEMMSGGLPRTPAQDLAEMAGKAAPKPAQGAIPVSSAPQAAKLYGSQVEAAGEGYGAIKAAKAAGEKVPEEGRRTAAQAAQRIGKEQEGNLTLQQISKLRPEDQQRILAAQVKAARAAKKGGTTLSSNLGGQFGEMSRIARDNPEFATKLALTVAGGAGGAALDDENPARGALLGAGVAHLGANGASRIARSFATGDTVKDALEPIISRAPNYIRGGLLSNPFSLIHNSIAGPWGANVLGGVEQYAKGVVNRDPVQRDVGKAVLKTASPLKWMKGFLESGGEASAKIDDVEDLGRAGQFVDPANPNLLDKMVKMPARVMLQGDLNTKHNMRESGMPEEVARQVTLTAEPRRALWKSIANMLKSHSGVNDDGQISNIGAMMLPFKRTAANIMESGTERTPLLGSIIDLMGDPTLRIPFKEQMVQQGIGASVFALGYGTAQMTNDDVDKFLKIHTLVSNLGGQYSLLANAGFMAGQIARKKGTGILSSSADGISRAIIGQEGMPLPTTEPFQKLINPYLKKMRGQPVDAKDFVPDIFIPKILGWGQDVVDKTTAVMKPAPVRGLRAPRSARTNTRTAAPTRAASRYRPPRQTN